jgi:predicted nucleotidyltransferase
MSDADNNPAWVSEICERVVARVGAIDGIRALALGGSRARSTAREDSDIDLALYYDPSAPFPIGQLDAAVHDLDDRHADGLVTPPGAWGTGVNGGGWLLIDDHHVDFLYRDLRRVREVVERCVRGEIDAVYQLGHPIGFQNQIYAGETHFCRPLYDPTEELGALKKLVEAYPPRMRQALIDKHLFDAQFELEIALGPARRGDVAYVSQCLSRSTGFMVLVLYALNQRFFINEKNAFIESEHFALQPSNLHREVDRILASIGNSPEVLTRSVTTMCAVAADLRTFCAEKFPSAIG